MTSLGCQILETRSPSVSKLIAVQKTARTACPLSLEAEVDIEKALQDAHNMTYSSILMHMP